VPVRIWKVLVYFKILKRLSRAMTGKIIKSTSNVAARKKKPPNFKPWPEYNASQGGKVNEAK
jgi:predicted phosphoadenosine phosphosulfate sulfurtransferase